MNPLPSIERLNELFLYMPETGNILNLTSKKGAAGVGELAGSVCSNSGYRVICVGGCGFRSHRIAWKMYYGQDPEDQIDHINQIRDDNRIVNLRAATNRVNSKNIKLPANNTSGFIGVGRASTGNNWYARICVNGKMLALGCHKDISDAIAARKEANIKYGFHENHGLSRLTTKESE